MPSLSKVQPKWSLSSLVFSIPFHSFFHLNYPHFFLFLIHLSSYSSCSPLSIGYSINSILYQRGIYPPDEFKVVKKYGLNMLVTTNVTLDNYIKNVLSQLSGKSSDILQGNKKPEAER